jgi:hypothetical protein
VICLRDVTSYQIAVAKIFTKFFFAVQVEMSPLGIGVLTNLDTDRPLACRHIFNGPSLRGLVVELKESLVCLFLNVKR